MSRRQDSHDRVLADAIQVVKTIAEQFTFNVALLVAGHEVDFGPGVEAPVAERLHAAVGPLLASGDAMRPNFGEYAQLSVGGNFRDKTSPVTAVVSFDQRSARELGNSTVVVPPARRMRLELKIAREPWRVTDYRLQSTEAGVAPQPI
jgi:hypothetical protein